MIERDEVLHIIDRHARAAAELPIQRALEAVAGEIRLMPESQALAAMAKERAALASTPIAVEPAPTETPCERALTEALRKRVRHHEYRCNSTATTLGDAVPPCSCGVDEARAALGPNPPRYLSVEQVHEVVARVFEVTKTAWPLIADIDRIIDAWTKP